MSVRKKLRSLAINQRFGARWLGIRRRVAEYRRRLMRRPHVVSVFLELDDPYSYLLSHYLPEMAEHYEVALHLYLTEAVTGSLRPAPDLYTEYANTDCKRLARELGIPFLDKGQSPPVEHRLAVLNALAAGADGAEASSELLQALAAYWRGDAEGVARRAEGAPSQSTPALLKENQARLQKLGHYNSAMLHYAGEWYWGVDRLHYLVERLEAVGAQKDRRAPAGFASIGQVMQADLPVTPPSAATSLPALEFFFSFRSPYSYLALRRTIEIADAFGIPLQLRPVLPMVMRGLPVPRSKLLYVVADAAREARRRNIPYGKLADPLGAGVERCLAVFQYARDEKREREFALHAGEAIFGEGIDVATDKGLRKVTAKSGLFWPGVKEALESNVWRDRVEENRASMMDSGSWGVPTVRIGEFVTWGQDRDWLLIRHLEELCDSGDGILI